MEIQSPYGNYTHEAWLSGQGKIYRLMTADELQAHWCIYKQVLDNKTIDILAWSVAENVFRANANTDQIGSPDAQSWIDRADYAARQVSDAHTSQGEYTKKIANIQAELVWRANNPEWDPKNPFAEEDPGELIVQGYP